MIRRKYVIPRLIVLGIVFLLVWPAVDPVVRWALVSTGQSMTLAKVDIGDVETSLLRGEVRLSDVQVANPRSPWKNLVEASEITLGLETDSLVRRNFIVRQGSVSGLRIDTDRATSGQLDPTFDWNLKFFGEELADSGRQWLDLFGNILQQQIEEEGEQLHSVRLVRELVQRWPAEYDRLEARVDSLKTRADKVRELFQTRTDDVLKNVEVFRQAAVELEAIQKEMAALGAEIDRLPEQALRDKNAIIEAKQRDIEQIGEKLRLAHIDAETLSQYLLGPELGERILTLASWANWARRHIPRETGRTQPVRRRGEDVLFPGIRPRPNFLVRSLELEGEVEIAGRPFPFQGTAADLASQPNVYGRPAMLWAEVKGPSTIRVEAVWDRTGGKPHDRIVIDCPDLVLAKRVLGREDRFAIAVSPGNTHLWILLELEGDELGGQILLKQEPVELVPCLDARCGGKRLVASLQTAVSEVRTLEVAVDLSGTLEKPDWRLRSNLGPQLVEGLNRMVREELEFRQAQLARHAHRQVEEQLAGFEEIVLARQKQVFDKLEFGESEIQRLGQTVARRIRVPDRILDKAVPDGLPLRF